MISLTFLTSVGAFKARAILACLHPRFFVALSGIGGLASTCEAHRSRQFHCHSRCFFLSGTPGDGLCLCFLPEM